MEIFNELELIFKEPKSSVITREQSAFDKISQGKSSKIVLFGAGGLGRRTLAGLRAIGIEPLAFLDNNSRLWGSSVDGIEVLSPKEGADRFKSSAVFVITIWHHGSIDKMQDRKEQLLKLDCQAITEFSTLYCKYPKEFLPFYMIDLPSHLYDFRDQIIQAARLFKNIDSKKVFLDEVKFRAFHNFAHFPTPVNHLTFFPKDLWHFNSSEVFIDCGAFTGDTIEAFIAEHPSFYNITAFEPDQISFPKLSKFVSGLPSTIQKKIQIYNFGTSSFAGEISFTSSGLASSKSGSGDEKIKCIRLDDFLVQPPTHIKMDIEGAETDSLIGAKEILQKHHPNLSICVYHRPSDLWEIPLLIHSINPEYQLYLRPHQLEGWDLVCYATVEKQ